MTTLFRWMVAALALVALAGSCGTDVGRDPGGGFVLPPLADAPRPARAVPGALPASLHLAMLRAVQAAEGHDFAAEGEALVARAGALGEEAWATIDRGGVTLAPVDGSFSLGVRTLRVGRRGSGALDPRAPALRGEGQEAVLAREGVEERYLSGPLGLEQTYRIEARPVGEGPLEIEVAFAGLAPAKVTGAEGVLALADGEGRTRAVYRDMAAMDAAGRELGARMVVGAAGVTLEVEDQGAAYPVLVDPLIAVQQAELIAADGTFGNAFGNSVSVSGDTAVIGANYKAFGANSAQGAAYVFVRSGTTWTQQAKLMAGDGAASDQFGVSVSVSGDTAVVGTYYEGIYARVTQGAAYVFVRGGTTWTQQAKLMAGDGARNDCFGYSVGVSGDTTVVGAYGANVAQGAAYVFVRSGTAWTQQAELTAGDGAMNDRFGWSASVSGDTAVVGAYEKTVGANSFQGAAYVFVRSGTTWTQQEKLTAGDGAVYDYFGNSVSVSGDTAVVGDCYKTVGANSFQGAAYVFLRSDTIWTQQAKLVAGDGAANDQFGWLVSVSGDTAVVGAQYKTVGANPQQGAAYVFVRSGTAWIQQTKLMAADGAANDLFGISVSVSGDTAVVGAQYKAVGANSSQGAAYVFLLKKGLGDPCGGAGECASGFCADGVCCNTACAAGACDACSVAAGAPSDGTCALLSGTACDDGNACTRSDVCTAGTCGGAAYTCTPTACQASSICDGSGGCTLVNKAAGVACPDDGNPCTADACDGSGTCAHGNLADGTGCGAGKVCVAGSCATGCFLGGALVAVGAANPANACQACTPTISTSSWSSKLDGTPCDDSNACTKGDVCTAGSCGGTAYTCTPTACQASSTCDGNGCTVANKAAGVACPDDGNPCTADACDGSGNCAHGVFADGTGCGAGQACVAGACATGCFLDGALVAAGTANPVNACQACTPSTSTSSWSSKADGTSCDDGDACTTTDACASGICVGTAPVVCAAKDGCHDAGACDHATGACTQPVKADGVACDDGDPGTVNDVCTAGVCAGVDHCAGVICAAKDACHEVGVCDHATGICSEPAKPDGTPCADGACQAGACVASPPDAGADSGTGGSAPGTGGGTPSTGPEPSDAAGGCGCRVAGEADERGRPPLSLLAVATLLAAARGLRRRL